MNIRSCLNKNLKNQFCFIVSFISIFSSSCISKAKNEEGIITGKLSNILFIKEFHDFGEIPANKNASAIFKFSNTGEAPLVISEVKTTCGCTVPEYPKKPIQPNEIGKIKVIYDAKYPGRFNKSITVFYNGKDSPKKLTIKGKVPYPKELDNVNN